MTQFRLRLRVDARQSKRIQAVKQTSLRPKPVQPLAPPEHGKGDFVMRRMLFLIALFFVCAPLAFAQQSRPDDYPRFEWFAGYSALGDGNKDDGRILTFYGSNTGLETSLARNLSRR